MPSAPVNPSDTQRQSPFRSHTYLVPVKTRRPTALLRVIPPQLPPPVQRLPDLPPYTPTTPSLSLSYETIATAGHEHRYPPTPHITPKPSAQSLGSQFAYGASSQNLLGQHPRSDRNVIGKRNTYTVESIDSGQVWIGSQVTVTRQSEESACKEFYWGRLICMCERRKDVTWFVFKDKRTAKFHFIMVKNDMVKWPLWHRFIFYLQSLCAYMRHRRLGHQLPV
jgi:hypothetical protein